MPRHGLDKWVEEQGEDYWNNAIEHGIDCSIYVPLNKLWRRYPVDIWRTAYRTANNYGYHDTNAVSNLISEHKPLNCVLEDWLVCMAIKRISEEIKQE